MHVVSVSTHDIWQNNMQDAATTSGASGAFRRCNPRVITKRKEESPLPMPFELPRNYEPSVMAALKKKMLSGRSKGKFIKAVAAAIFRFKGYPTTPEYEHIGQQIISKYPFLKSMSGSGYVSIHTCVFHGVSCTCGHYI